MSLSPRPTPRTRRLTLTSSHTGMTPPAPVWASPSTQTPDLPFMARSGWPASGRSNSTPWPEGFLFTFVMGQVKPSQDIGLLSSASGGPPPLPH